MSEKNSGSGFATAEAAEAAFYEAFSSCDVEAMAVVWAEEGVVCIHPGSAALLGREVVMQSWTSILCNAERPTLHVEVLSRTVSNDMAVHIVEEYLTAGGGARMTSMVLATNVYRREQDGWRLLEHHASLPGPGQSSIHSETKGNPTIQ